MAIRCLVLLQWNKPQRLNHLPTRYISPIEHCESSAKPRCGYRCVPRCTVFKKYDIFKLDEHSDTSELDKIGNFRLLKRIQLNYTDAVMIVASTISVVMGRRPASLAERNRIESRSVSLSYWTL